MLTPLIIEVSTLLKKAEKPFWLGGGYALDVFMQKETRAHEDLDFIVKRDDQLIFQNIMSRWDLQAADPPGSGSLLPWTKGHFYDLPIHNIWCRKNESSAWDVELLFSEFEGEEWVYRRNRDIRGPIENFSWSYEGLLDVIAPEIQLLYKSRSKRPKDIQDLENCLPHLSEFKKDQLKSWIAIDSGSEHPWLELIGKYNNRPTYGDFK